MNDDPTRVMRTEQPEPPRRGGGMPTEQRIGRMRLAIAILVAVIVGLVIAVFAMAGGNGEEDVTPVTEGTELPAQPVEPAPTPVEPEGDIGDGDTGGLSPEGPPETDTGGSPEGEGASPDTGGGTDGGGTDGGGAEPGGGDSGGITP